MPAVLTAVQLPLTLLLMQVIQLQGDQRKNVSTFLVGNKICKKDQVKIHGF